MVNKVIKEKVVCKCGHTFESHSLLSHEVMFGLFLLLIFVNIGSFLVKDDFSIQKYAHSMVLGHIVSTLVLVVLLGIINSCYSNWLGCNFETDTQKCDCKRYKERARM